MPDLTIIEDQLETMRATYEELRLEADEDGHRDDEERALIELVGGQIAELERLIAAQRGETPTVGEGGEDGDRDEDAKKAWQDLASDYKSLLILHAELKKAGDERAEDLNVYLQAISSHLASEDFESAVSQAILAGLWADENNVWDDYFEEPSGDDTGQAQEEDHEESGKLAWDKMGGDAGLTKVRAFVRELEAQGSEHAARVAEYLANMEAAVQSEDWKAAVTAAVLLADYMDDNDLDLPDSGGDSHDAGGTDDAGERGGDIHRGPDEDDASDEEEDEYPEKELWESWQFLHDKMKKLHEDLQEIEHPVADGLGAILDKIREAEGKTEYRRANKLLTEDAAKFIETHDLWDAVEGGDEDIPPLFAGDPFPRRIEKLKVLRRELDRADHEKADAFGKLVDEIPEKVTNFSELIPRERRTQEAWEYADKHDLWDIISGLPGADEEALFWEHNGDKYRGLQNLHRSIEDTGQDFAPRLGDKLREIDEHIGKDNFYLAGVLIDEAWDLAKDHDMIDEGPKDIWDGLRDDVADLRELASAAQVQDGLRDEGYPHADPLGTFVDAMDAAEESLDWQEAVDQYEAGKAYADKHDIWDDVGVYPSDDEEEEDEDGEEDEYPEKTRWEGASFFYGNVQKLYDQLTEMQHPLANRLGAYLDEIEEAVTKQEYMRAHDLLMEEVKDFTYDNDLWDAVKSGDDEENWIPEETQEKISKLKELSRELKRMDHEKSDDFERLVDAIPDRVTEFSEIIPAGRAISEAENFADRHDLWHAVPPLPKGEEEKIFWDIKGNHYRELSALHRRLKEAGHEKAVRLGEKLAEVDEAIDEDHFHLAGIFLGEAADLAEKYDLWDASPPPGETDEDEDGWLSRAADFAELQRLVSALTSGGVRVASELSGTVTQILRAVATGDFQGAADILDDALERARRAAEELVSEDEGWLERATDFDELRSLADRLVSAGVDGATEAAGTVADILAEAASGNFDTAGSLLDDALAQARELAEELGEDDEGGAGGGFNPATATIKGKVGKGGKNWPADVKTVQLLLNHHGASLEPDSDCGRLTIGAIEKFQQETFGWKDGRVDPGGQTFAALTGALSIDDVVETASEVVRDVTETVSDAAEAVADAIGDAVDSAGEFLDNLWGGDEDEEEEQTDRT